MDLSTFFRVVLRGWWLILLSVITTAGSAAYVVTKQTPVYQAATTVMLRENPSLEPNQVINALNLLAKPTTINTLARLAEGSFMQEQIARTLNIDLSIVSSSELSAIVVPESNLIEIRASSSDPGLAAAITNAVGEELRKRVPEKVLQIDVTDRAVPPTSPTRPQPARTITLGVLFGAALGVVFALLAYFLQTMRQSANAVENKPERAPQAMPELAMETSSNKTQQLFTRTP